MLNKENLNNFSKLSDEEIRSRITNAASMGNINPERLRSILSDTDKIRSVISKMSPADIERMLRIIGKDKAEKMAEKLKENL